MVAGWPGYRLSRKCNSFLFFSNYSGIMLDSRNFLLFQKLCWHIRRMPSLKVMLILGQHTSENIAPSSLTNGSIIDEGVATNCNTARHADRCMAIAQL